MNSAHDNLGANVTQAIPFLWVKDIEASLRFYLGGLGFILTHQWAPEAPGQTSPGRIRWCRLQLGQADIMLQEFRPELRPAEALGVGTSVCFQCRDALALYRGFKARGIPTRKRPFVGNAMWVVPLSDPDGYQLEFTSPTDAQEESELAETE